MGLQLLLFSVSLAFCQDPTGIFEGQIIDPSGALVPNAAITITNSFTGFTATQRSSTTGGFHFSYLPVGSYSLHVSVKGFSNFDTSNVHLDVNRVVHLPITLTVAGSKDTAEVNAMAATVDVSSTLGNVVLTAMQSIYR